MKSKGYLIGSIRLKTLFEEFITLCLALTVKVVLAEKNEKQFYCFQLLMLASS